MKMWCMAALMIVALGLDRESCRAAPHAISGTVPASQPAAKLPSVLIPSVPHVLQKPDFCGEACVAMMLGKLKHQGDQDWVFNQSGLDPLLGRGVHTTSVVIHK